MTKHTDSSPGNAQTGAGEIRKLCEQAADVIRSKYIGANPQSVRDEIKAEVAAMIEAVFLPECSRLASRVAILESALLQAVGEIADYRGVYEDPETCEQKIAAGVQRRIVEAEKLLAGAHAEEKE